MGKERYDRYLGEDEITSYINEGLPPTQEMLTALSSHLDKAIQLYNDIVEYATPEEKQLVSKILRNYNVPWDL